MPSSLVYILILVLSELFLIFAALSYFLFKKYILLRNDIEIINKELLDQQHEASNPSIGLDEIENYLSQQIQNTQDCLNVAHDTRHAITEDQDTSYDLRIALLQAELQTMRDDPSREGYWADLCERYLSIAEHFSPQRCNDDDQDSTLDEALQELDLDLNQEMLIDEESEENQSIAPPTQGEQIRDTISTAEEEINRLRSVINNQYVSIDRLKDDMIALKNGDTSSELVSSLETKLTEFETAQHQFQQCIDVLAKENERLKEQMIQLESEVLPSVDAEQSQYIAQLEQENSALQNRLDQVNAGLNEKSDDSQDETRSESTASNELSRVQKELQESENLIKNLIQTNKEQLQCIAMLEGEIDDLKALHSDGLHQHESSAEMKAAEAETKNDSMNIIDELKSNLASKNAELELLKGEYEAMKLKYIALHQQRRA